MFVTENGLLWCSTDTKHRYQRLMRDHGHQLWGYVGGRPRLPDMMQDLLSAAQEAGIL